jgi:glycosyltransferase involved in cell wall biosynthesis
MLEHAHIPVITIDSLERDISLKKEWAFAQELWHILKHERPDILHVNSSKAGLVGALLGRLARVPRVVFTAHGWAFNEDRPWWQKPIIKALHWLTVLLAHRTIAVSNATASEMNWPGVRKRMKVLNPGRDIGIRFSRLEAREELTHYAPTLKAHQRDPWLGMIAELHPIKRHKILLEAVSTLIEAHPSLRVILIGDGELKQTLAEAISPSGLSEHVFLLGAVSEAARFLRAFDLLTLPSHSESYGYVLHEAGLLSVPVVASNVGGIRDIVRHNESGLLAPPDDKAALASALNALLSDPARGEELASALHAAMAKRTVQHMTRATEALYIL